MHTGQTGLSGLSGMGGQAPSSLLNGLAAYWKLEEASGTRFDAAGSSHLTSNNSVGQATGKVGNCASFVAASSQSLSAPSNTALQLATGSFTIGLWVKATTLPGTVMLMVAKGSSAADANSEYKLSLSASNNFSFTMGNGAGSSSGPSFVNLGAAVAGTWYFLLQWYDAQTQVLSVQGNNGTPNTSAPFNNGGFSSTGSLFLATIAGGGVFWNGLIDEVGFWKRVLTAAERTALWNAGNGTSWPFLGLGV